MQKNTMRVKEKRVPFPCHPKLCWAVTDTGYPGTIYRKCPICGKVYEINTETNIMTIMVPQNSDDKAIKLFDLVSDVLNRGDDVLIHMTPGGGWKIRAQRGDFICTIE